MICGLGGCRNRSVIVVEARNGDVFDLCRDCAGFHVAFSGYRIVGAFEVSPSRVMGTPRVDGGGDRSRDPEWSGKSVWGPDRIRLKLAVLAVALILGMFLDAGTLP